MERDGGNDEGLVILISFFDLEAGWVSVSCIVLFILIQFSVCRVDRILIRWRHESLNFHYPNC